MKITIDGVEYTIIEMTADGRDVETLSADEERLWRQKVAKKYFETVDPRLKVNLPGESQKGLL